MLHVWWAFYTILKHWELNPHTSPPQPKQRPHCKQTNWFPAVAAVLLSVPRSKDSTQAGQQTCKFSRLEMRLRYSRDFNLASESLRKLSVEHRCHDVRERTPNGNANSFCFLEKNALASSLRLGVLSVKTFYSEIITQKTALELQSSTTQLLDRSYKAPYLRYVRSTWRL